MPSMDASGGAAGGGGGIGGGDIAGGAAGGMRGGGGGGGGGGDMPQAAPSLTLTVRWHSALPIKQAIAKTRFGDEVATSPEAAKLLAHVETNYIVGISGFPLQMVRANPSQLKSAAMLNIKGKDSIQAVDVKGDREGERANLYLFFPRGEIKAEDGDVEVVLKLGPMEIKRKFKLKDMVYDGKLEI